MQKIYIFIEHGGKSQQHDTLVRRCNQKDEVQVLPTPPSKEGRHKA